MGFHAEWISKYRAVVIATLLVRGQILHIALSPTKPPHHKSKDQKICAYIQRFA
jgi:hypothetical protein